MIIAALVLASHVLIGNYLTTAPSGIAFVVNDKAGFVVDTGAPFYAGMSAPDDSYHEVVYAMEGANVILEWGRRGDSMVAKVSADKPALIPLKLGQTWPGFTTTYTATDEGAKGECTGYLWELRSSPRPVRSSNSEIVVSVSPDQPAYLVAGIGNLPAFYQIGAQLTKARTDYQKVRPRAVGAYGDFVGPISDNLNNSRIYSSDNRTVAHSVSRGWAPTPNDAPYFCWDSFFNGNLASLDDPLTARNTIRAILAWQTPEGLVPNFGHWEFEDSRSSDDRSQPPVGAMCVWKMHQRWPDRSFLQEVYFSLLKWHRWWPRARDGNRNGLLEWGSATKKLQGAKWETGWDDTVAFEGAQMIGPNMNVDAVDLNSLWAADAQYLALIAKELGRKKDVIELNEDHKRMCDLINKELWNEELGIYCSRHWGGDLLTRLTPMNFYPLICGAADPARAKRVIDVLTDPQRFWGKFSVPTVSFDDPVWPQQDYWKGKVWPPVNYLVYQGLVRYATPTVLNQFAAVSREIFMRNWIDKRVCGENYLSTTGAQSSDAHYTWGALLPLIALENVCRLDDDGSVVLNGTYESPFDLFNIPLRGKRYQVHVTKRKTELLLNGRAVITARGEILKGRL